MALALLPGSSAAALCDLAALDAFSTATGADVAWHVNPAFRDAQRHFDVNNAPAPSSAICAIALRAAPPRPTKQKLPIVDGGVLRAGRFEHGAGLCFPQKTLQSSYDRRPPQPGHGPIYGWTDAVYRASETQSTSWPLATTRDRRAGPDEKEVWVWRLRRRGARHRGS